MPTLNIEGFDGIIPRAGPSRIGADNATIALNVKLQSGELRPWRLPVDVEVPAISSVQGIYNLIGPANATAWLTWNCDVDVVGPPQADGGDYRIYFTGATITPQKTNWSLATTGTATNGYPIKTMPMGLPQPTTAPSCTASSTASPTTAYAYVYTFVNQFGAVQEESAPSPATVVTLASSGATVTVSGFATGQMTTGMGYDPAFINIYRSVAGTSGASYQFVAQIPWAQTSYVDSLTALQLGANLTSTYYTPPPSNLQGLVEMPNGMLAGFTGNQIWFAEPYHPHAWPVVYMQTVEFPIVGLGVFGNSLFVGTTKNPYLLTGLNPSAMTMEKLPIIQACISKRSIQSDQWGVIYASPNGLLAVGPGVQDIVTQSVFTRDEWQALNPASIIGMLYNNMYLGFYASGTNPVQAFVFTRNDRPTLVDLQFPAVAVFQSRTNNNIYAVNQDDNKIYQLDADPVNNTIFQWQSRMYIMPEPCSFGALKVQADWTAIQLAIAEQAAQQAAQQQSQQTWNAAGTNTLGGCLNDVVLDTYTINGSALASVPPVVSNAFVQCIIYGDGVQLFQTNLTSNEPIRLPAGIKCLTWQVFLSGNVSVRKFSMATTVGELRQV
ncbi:hypothetical protein [Paraburkholderia unamae]|uniref:Uncharacterized protein n=1 Tax=Paraburkholderia unamae TaxID=219649 RepID=A0ACC6RHD5_9BURK